MPSPNTTLPLLPPDTLAAPPIASETSPPTTPDKPAPAAKYMEQPINIVMEGDFDGFYLFLQEVERMRRIAQIHTMKLGRIDANRRDDEEKAAPMKAEFTLSIYYRPDSMVSEQA